MEEDQQQKKHKRYQRFDEEFKREAVRLSQLEGRTVAATARSLGIDTNTLGLWRKKYGASVTAVPSAVRRDDVADGARERELLELRKRLREAETERDILKKAVAVISRSV